jgi:hypothetical protein
MSETERRRARPPVREVVELLKSAPQPDPAFADDLEAIQTQQPPMTEVRWAP